VGGSGTGVGGGSNLGRRPEAYTWHSGFQACNLPRMHAYASSWLQASQGSGHGLRREESCRAGCSSDYRCVRECPGFLHRSISLAWGVQHNVLVSTGFAMKVTSKWLGGTVFHSMDAALRTFQGHRLAKTNIGEKELCRRSFILAIRNLGSVRQLRKRSHGWYRVYKVYKK